RLRAILAATPGSNRDVLPAIHHVHARSGIASGWQLILPQRPPRVLLESPDLFVGRCGYEDEASSGSDGTAEVHRAGIVNSFSREFRVLTQRDLPQDFPLEKVNGVQSPPRRRNERHSARIG